MKIAVLTLLLIISVMGPVWARLGETEDQLTARYGTPLPKDSFKGEGNIPDLIFQKGGYNVYVFLMNGVSAQETFNKINGENITFQEIQILLTANAQSREWEAPQKTADGNQEWQRDDGSVAKLAGGTVFTITAKELLNADTAAKKEISKPTLDGF